MPFARDKRKAKIPKHRHHRHNQPYCASQDNRRRSRMNRNAFQMDLQSFRSLQKFEKWKRIFYMRMEHKQRFDSIVSYLILRADWEIRKCVRMCFSNAVYNSQIRNQMSLEDDRGKNAVQSFGIYSQVYCPR